MEPAGDRPAAGAAWMEPAGERLADPAARIERARALAWRALNRRDRTELELRRILAEKRVAPEEADSVVGELRDGGFIDDAGFARRFAEDRRRLDGWGSERIERRLRDLGVEREQVTAALDEREHDELDAALALLRRRVTTVPRTPRERDRALALLVRKGYELELAHDALRRFAGADEEF